MRFDNGGEYCSREFKEYHSINGIKHEKPVPVCKEALTGSVENLKVFGYKALQMLTFQNKIEKYYMKKKKIFFLVQ